jgi:hypothetical protein
MIMVDLGNIKYKGLEEFAVDYARNYVFGTPMCPILFIGEDDRKKKHFYGTFKLTVKQLVIH